MHSPPSLTPRQSHIWHVLAHSAYTLIKLEGPRRMAHDCGQILMWNAQPIRDVITTDHNSSTNDLDASMAVVHIAHCCAPSFFAMRNSNLMYQNRQGFDFIPLLQWARTTARNKNLNENCSCTLHMP